MSASNPCLQIGLSTRGQGADLVSKLSVSIREVPLVTEVNGTLMGRLPVARQARPLLLRCVLAFRGLLHKVQDQMPESREHVLVNGAVDVPVRASETVAGQRAQDRED